MGEARRHRRPARRRASAEARREATKRRRRLAASWAVRKSCLAFEVSVSHCRSLPATPSPRGAPLAIIRAVRFALLLMLVGAPCLAQTTAPATAPGPDIGRAVYVGDELLRAYD